MNPYEIIAPAIPSGQVYQFTTDYDVEYEVRFGRKKENILHSVVVFGVLNDEYEGEEYVLTNKGDVFRVMTTIAVVIKMYMKEHPNMQTYEFTGIFGDSDLEEYPSQRTKLYMRYIPLVFDSKSWITGIEGNRIFANKRGI